MKCPVCGDNLPDNSVDAAGSLIGDGLVDLGAVMLDHRPAKQLPRRGELLSAPAQKG